MAKMGAPSKKPDNLIEMVDQYLTDCKDLFTSEGNTVKLPTISGFALEIGFNESTMHEWAKKDKDFSKSLEKIKTEQRNRLLNQGLAGNYNSTIAKLILSSNHGMVERKEVDQTNRFPDGVDINFVEPKDDK